MLTSDLFILYLMLYTKIWRWLSSWCLIKLLDLFYIGLHIQKTDKQTKKKKKHNSSESDVSVSYPAHIFKWLQCGWWEANWDVRVSPAMLQTNRFCLKTHRHFRPLFASLLPLSPTQDSRRHFLAPWKKVVVDRNTLLARESEKHTFLEVIPTK